MTTQSERREIIRAALEKIRKAHGGVLRPRDVVQAASNKLHPLHDEFEWNNEKAANKHREQQARILITTYVSAKVTVCDLVVAAPYYVKDPTLPAGKQGYTTLTGMDKVSARETLLSEFQRCKSAIDRARGVCAVLDREHPKLGLASELEALLQRLVYLEEQLAKAA